MKYQTLSEHAEDLWRAQGRTVPDKVTQQADWVKMFERWILYGSPVFGNLQNKKPRVSKECLGGA